MQSEYIITPEMKEGYSAFTGGILKQIVGKSVEKMLDSVLGPVGTQFELPINTKQPMRRVVIESPLSPANGHTFKSNQRYARRCMKDSLDRGEAPYASHLLYTQMLDDDIPAERTLGMEAGFLWGEAAQTVAVYTDRGMSSGMIEGIKRAVARGANIEFRTIGDDE